MDWDAEFCKLTFSTRLVEAILEQLLLLIIKEQNFP